MDFFPRLDPPPPTNKKRLPRALKTTQEMMISSHPVVSSPDLSDSLLSSPEKNRPVTPPVSPRRAEEPPERSPEPPEVQENQEDPYTDPEEHRPAETTTDHVKDDGDGDQVHVLRSVPDLIHKDNMELKPKVIGSESTMVSTTRPGKGGHRSDLGEGEVVQNGSVEHKKASAAENDEPHPDLLSFE